LQKYIAPYLFGKPKKKPVDEVLDDIDKKVETRTNDLNKEISAVRDLITSQQREHSQQLNREFSNFRSDLDAIKGLLLNRKQFPGPHRRGSGKQAFIWHYHREQEEPRSWWFVGKHGIRPERWDNATPAGHGTGIQSEVLIRSRILCVFSQLRLLLIVMYS